MAKLDHDKLCNKIKGRTGREISPFYDRCQTHPRTTPEMIKFIEDLCKRLDNHGVPYQFVFDEKHMNWKFYQEEAKQIIHALKTISYDNGINNENIRIYHYLVKGPNGKKYVYTTQHYRGRPKGFEMLGELKRESIRKDDFDTWPKEKRLQEFKSVSQT